MVVAAVMVAIVLVSLYVVMQRRRNANKPELPARQLETQEAPPRPPPRGKVPFTTSLMDYMTRESKPAKPEADVEKNESNWKTRSLPLKSDDTYQYSQPEGSPNRATSLDQALYTKVDDGKVAAEDKPVVPDEKMETIEEPPVEPNVDENANEEEPEEEDEEAEEEEEDTVRSPAPAAVPGRDYAAVDYEKKRESRLMKEQNPEEEEEESEEEEEEEEEENDDAVSPEVPPKSADLVENKKPAEEKGTKEEKETPPVEPEKSESEVEDKASADRKRNRAEPEKPTAEKSDQPRRMRWRAEPEEESQLSTGLRRTRDREK